MSPNKSRSCWVAGIALALAASAALAQDTPPPGSPQPNPAPRARDAEPPPQARSPDAQNAQPREPGPQLPLTPLASVVERVARSSNKQFLIDTYVRPQVYLSGMRPEDITYPILLSILRTNMLAAVTIEGRVNIVNVQEVRSYPLPLVQQDDRNIPADEWVTRIVTLHSIEAVQLVPILRPLLPQFAHLAALAPNKLIIVDRYANVQRITTIAESLDK
jgi:type II secretory pathway component GspD/PulD (secretin)